MSGTIFVITDKDIYNMISGQYFPIDEYIASFNDSVLINFMQILI